MQACLSVTATIHMALLLSHQPALRRPAILPRCQILCSWIPSALVRPSLLCSCTVEPASRQRTKLAWAPTQSASATPVICTDISPTQAHCRADRRLHKGTGAVAGGSARAGSAPGEHRPPRPQQSGPQSSAPRPGPPRQEAPPGQCQRPVCTLSLPDGALLGRRLPCQPPCKRQLLAVTGSSLHRELGTRPAY